MATEKRLEDWLDTMVRYGHDPVVNANGTLSTWEKGVFVCGAVVGIKCGRCGWCACPECDDRYNRRMVPRKCEAA